MPPTQQPEHKQNLICSGSESVDDTGTLPARLQVVGGVTALGNVSLKKKMIQQHEVRGNKNSKVYICSQS